MQLVSVRIWTRVTVSVSYEDNHYTKGGKMNAQNFKQILQKMSMSSVESLGQLSDDIKP